MIRVVIDTNVVVSAALIDRGLPAAVLSLALGKRIQMVVSAAVLAEYETVLNRPRLKFPPERVKALLADIRNAAKMAKPTRTIAEINDDPDNRFLECAAAGRADYLITGNTRHFPKAFETTAIVTPKQFIDLILPLLAKLPQ
jgi:putative PIN family toxin of toxin-antitoxin system